MNRLIEAAKLICTAILLTSCADPLLNSDNNPVKQLGNGEYEYYFKYSDGCIGDYIKTCALKSLQERNLVPSDCKDIKILKGGKGENGWAWAKFTC